MASIREAAVLHNFFFNVIGLFERSLFFSSIPLRPLLKAATEILMKRYGIEVNGPNAYDLQVKDDRVYSLAISRGLLGMCDAFVEKYADADDVEQFFYKVFQNRMLFIILSFHPYARLLSLLNVTFDVQTIGNSLKDGGEQYDRGNAMIKLCPGPKRLCSSINYDETDDIAEAEIKQCELNAKKLKLEPGMTLLDIGCGFGGLAKYFATNYYVPVTGITVSKEMASFAAEKCQKLDVKIELKDYREIKGRFDRIVSVEMIEQIGVHHFREFFSIVYDHLNDGIFLLHVVTHNDWYSCEYNPIFEKHLGIRVTCPQIKRVVNEACRYFVLEHVENIGYNVGITWKNWLKNIKRHTPEEANLTEREYRNAILYAVAG